MSLLLARLGGTAYTLEVETGAFVTEGVSASTRKGSAVFGQAGAFAVAGAPNALRAGYRVPAVSGSFSVTGTNASMRHGHELDLTSGAYIVTGVAALLIKGSTVAAAVGSFTLEATHAGLRQGLGLFAGIGAFEIEGSDAVFRVGHVLATDAGPFALTGAASILKHGSVVHALSGSFVETGVAASLLVQRNLVAGAETFQVIGADADFEYTPSGVFRLNAATGSFVATSADADLAHTRIPIPSASPGGHWSHAHPLRVERMPASYAMAAGSASFRLSVAPVSLRPHRRLASEPSTLITKRSATFTIHRALHAGGDVLVVSTLEASARAGRRVSATPVSFASACPTARLSTGVDPVAKAWIALQREITDEDELLLLGVLDR